MKLDNGNNLLCTWSDNACVESLASALVGQFWERAPLLVLTVNFSIAGGPPIRQNFKAAVSFPVVGRNIRALDLLLN